MIRIAIISENSLDLQKTAKMIARMSDQIRYNVVIKEYNAEKQLILDLERNVLYNIYVLNLEMGEIARFELAEKIHLQDPGAVIVFNYLGGNLQKQSVQFIPYATLIKSEGENSILSIMNRIFEEVNRVEDKIYIMQKGRHCFRIPVDEIIFLSREGKNSVFHCEKGGIFKERKSLKKIYDSLPENQFTYIDKGVIVNLTQIADYTGNNLVTKENHTLYMSRRARAELHNLFLNRNTQ